MPRKPKRAVSASPGYWPADIPRGLPHPVQGPPAPEPAPNPNAPWPHNGQPHPAYGPVEDLPRDEHGRIPVTYYCSPAELARIATPVLRAERHDGFTTDRQRSFLEALAAGSSVSEAACAAGISRKTVYARRNAPDAHAFRAAWDEAQRCAVRVLADTAFDMAINGVEEPVWHQGEIVGRRTRYFERLIIHLLAVRDPLNFAPLRELPAWQGLRGRQEAAALAAPADPVLQQIGVEPPEEAATLLPSSPLPTGDFPAAARLEAATGEP